MAENQAQSAQALAARTSSTIVTMCKVRKTKLGKPLTGSTEIERQEKKELHFLHPDLEKGSLVPRDSYWFSGQVGRVFPPGLTKAHKSKSSSWPGHDIGRSPIARIRRRG